MLSRRYQNSECKNGMANPKPVPRKSSPESLEGPHLRYKDKEKRKLYLREYNSRSEVKEAKKNYDKKYRSNPERRKRDWELFIRKEYGIESSEYTRLYDTQAGVCAICRKPPSGRKTRLSVDHCHTTGKVRGLLCDKCNQGIGYFDDNVSLVKRALTYLS